MMYHEDRGWGIDTSEGGDAGGKLGNRLDAIEARVASARSSTHSTSLRNEGLPVWLPPHSLLRPVVTNIERNAIFFADDTLIHDDAAT